MISAALRRQIGFVSSKTNSPELLLAKWLRSVKISVEDPIDWIYNEVGEGEHQLGVVL